MNDVWVEPVEHTEIVDYDAFLEEMYTTYTDVLPEYFQLTQMQWKFVFNYLDCLDTRKAARLAGYSAKNDRNLTTYCNVILRNPKVSFWIGKFMSERALPQDAVLARLAAIATGSIGDFITVLPETGDVFFDMRKAEEAGVLPLIKRLRYVKSGPGKGGVEIELHDPLRALELIGKHLGMFQDVNVKVDQYTIKVVREGDKDGKDRS